MGLAIARKKAREWLDMIEQGIDPQAVARQHKQEAQRDKRTTFIVVAEDWLRDAVRGQRKAREVEADLRREFTRAGAIGRSRKSQRSTCARRSRK